MKTPPTTARLATLDGIINDVLPQFINPIPRRETVRNWLDAANIPRFKSNPLAKRGGGPVYYSIAHTEKFLRSRVLPRMGKVAK